MRTYEEVKESVRKSQVALMEKYNEKLHYSRTNREEERLLTLAIHRIEHQLDNLDEITNVEIGACVLDIMDGLFHYHTFFYNMWMTDEGFSDVLSILTSPTNPKCGMACQRLGIAESDLKYFRRRNPREEQARAEFIRRINTNFGTSIPTSYRDRYDAEEKYSIAQTRKSQEEQDDAFVKFTSMRSVMGEFKECEGSYILKSDIPGYREAEERIQARQKQKALNVKKGN